MAVLPFFHIYGLVVLLNLHLALGAKLVIMPKFDFVPFLGAASLPSLALSSPFAIPVSHMILSSLI